MPVRTGFAAIKQRVAVTASRKTPEIYYQSFGERLSDLYGRSRWALAGLALTVWETEIRVRVDELLQTNSGSIYRGQGVHMTSIRHCWMIGRRKEYAAPTVVICCGDRTVLRRTMRVIKEHELLKERDFHVKGIDPGHLQLYSGGESAIDPNERTTESFGQHCFTPDHLNTPQSTSRQTSSCDNETHDLLQKGTECRNICGAGIITKDSQKKATIGGALTIDKICYGLTSAHVLNVKNLVNEAQEISAYDGAEMYDRYWAEEESVQGDSDNEVSSASLDQDIGEPDNQIVVGAPMPSRPSSRVSDEFVIQSTSC